MPAVFASLMRVQKVRNIFKQIAMFPQVRLSAAEERVTRAEWERRESVTGLERQLAAARAEVLDWRREVAAAEAERDRLAADKKLLTRRGSSSSLYAGYNGTPKARGARCNITPFSVVTQNLLFWHLTGLILERFPTHYGGDDHHDGGARSLRKRMRFREV